jgi:hypothetical protein
MYILLQHNTQGCYITRAMFFFRCSTIPRVSPPEMANNMKILFEDRSDNHDLEIKVYMYIGTLPRAS